MRHIGSTIALVLGILYFISALSPPGPGLVAGPIMIIGALAYRSAKKRKLGEVASTTTRKVLEIAALVLVCAVVLMQNNLKEHIAQEPVPNALIPLWAVLAYVMANIIPWKSDLHRTST